MTEREFDQEITDELYRRHLVAVERVMPTRYHDVPLHDDVASWADRLVAGHRGNLLLIGPVGAGKTAQAWNTVRRIAAAKWTGTWAFWGAADLAEAFRPGDRAETVIQETRTVDLLVIDDLGAARFTDWQVEQLYRVLDLRWQWSRPTMVASNLPPQELAAGLGDRIASRLQDGAVIVQIRGADRRRS